MRKTRILLTHKKEAVETVALEDLVGEHTLMGVDFEAGQTDDNDDSQVINFVLDGITYTAAEDPVDGYRSCMKDIKKSNATVKNRFAWRVVGKMRGGESDIIDFTDVKTSNVVLSVGTDHTDDYYPWFVAEFSPENSVQARDHLYADISPVQVKTAPRNRPTSTRKRS